MLKVVILSVHDFASSAYEFKKAVESVSDDIDIKLIKLYSYKFANNKSSEADVILTSKGIDSRKVQKWIDEADIIHLKGDEYPSLEWYSLKIPNNKPIIFTAGGSRFRNRVGNKHPAIVSKYTRIPRFITTITPDLNYISIKGYYTQHSINSTQFDNEFVFDSYPVIAHSPSNRSVKNTKLFEKVLFDLKNEGYEFELDIIENVNNDECVARKRNVQLFFDQSKIPFYGKSALEAMQFGIPVISYISDSSIQKSNNKISKKKDLPIIDCGYSYEDMYKSFKFILDKFNRGDREYIEDISFKTKEWCDKFHSYEVTGDMWVNIYNSVLKGTQSNKNRYFDFGKGILTSKDNFKVKDKLQFRAFSNDSKLYFFAKKGSTHFAEPYLEKLSGVVKIVGQSFNVYSKIMQEAKSNDYIWIEWGGAFAKKILSKYNTKAKVILRLHDWEIRSGLVRDIDFNKVDVLWFINKEFRHDFFNQVNIFRPSLFLSNALNTDSFNFNNRKVYGKNIVCVAVSFSKRKNFYRAVELFNKVLELDYSFKLFIKAPLRTGEDREELTRCYNRSVELGIEDKISWDTWDINNKFTDKRDLEHYLKDKDVIISTSDHEGFHCTVGESMLKGLHPAVYKWDKGFPEQFWGEWVFYNLDDMAKSIVYRSNLSNKDQIKLGEYYKKYVEDNFSSNILSKDFMNTLFNRSTILFVTHNHLYKYNVRGAEKSLKIIVDYLSNIGYNIVVMNHNMKRVIKFEREVKDNVVYYDVACDRFTGVKGNFQNKLSEVIEKEKPDLAFSYAIAMKESYDVFKRYKLPYILLVRWFRLINPLPPGDLMNREMDKNFVNEHKKLFTDAEKIITNNKYSVDVIRRFYNVESDYSYVPYFSKENNFNINRDGYILLVTPKKDLMEDELLYYLAENMPNEKFLAVNAPKQKRGLKLDNLEYVDYQGNMSQILANAKTLLYPVYKNDVCGTSRIIVEAMSYGLPVICNRRAGINEKIPDDFTVSKDADFSEWVDKINEYNYDLMYYKKLSLEYFRKYDSYSQLDVFIKNINDVLKKYKD